MNISKTSGSVAINLYMMHYWGGAKAALGFGSDQIKTLVTMANIAPIRVIMGKMLGPN